MAARVAAGSGWGRRSTTRSRAVTRSRHGSTPRIRGTTPPCWRTDSVHGRCRRGLGPGRQRQRGRPRPADEVRPAPGQAPRPRADRGAVLARRRRALDETAIGGVPTTLAPPRPVDQPPFVDGAVRDVHGARAVGDGPPLTDGDGPSLPPPLPSRQRPGAPNDGPPVNVTSRPDLAAGRPWACWGARRPSSDERRPRARIAGVSQEPEPGWSFDRVRLPRRRAPARRDDRAEAILVEGGPEHGWSPYAAGESTSPPSTHRDRLMAETADRVAATMGLRTCGRPCRAWSFACPCRWTRRSPRATRWPRSRP